MSCRSAQAKEDHEPPSPLDPRFCGAGPRLATGLRPPFLFSKQVHAPVNRIANTVHFLGAGGELTGTDGVGGDRKQNGFPVD